MMELTEANQIRTQLVDRRHRLEHEIGRIGAQPALAHLLEEVDAALARVSAGTFGLCEECQDVIEPDRIAADPLVRFCLDHLPPAEQRALERDLQLAAEIQRGLLPAVRTELPRWDVAYHYRAARIVSGDYCDVIAAPTGDVYFMVGDVSGKGVAASMLMAHMHAMFRALVPSGLPLEALVDRASRVFCESTLPMHYATLVCGKAAPSGDVELCNAGHPPPLLIRRAAIEPVDSTGLPIGMFCGSRVGVTRLTLAPEDALLLYTDGLLDAEDAERCPYGADRLAAVAGRACRVSPQSVLDACISDLARHVGATPYADDVTVMVVARRPLS